MCVHVLCYNDQLCIIKLNDLFMTEHLFKHVKFK